MTSWDGDILQTFLIIYKRRCCMFLFMFPVCSFLCLLVFDLSFSYYCMFLYRRETQEQSQWKTNGVPKPNKCSRTLPNKLTCQTGQLFLAWLVCVCLLSCLRTFPIAANLLPGERMLHPLACGPAVWSPVFKRITRMFFLPHYCTVHLSPSVSKCSPQGNDFDLAWRGGMTHLQVLSLFAMI